MPVLRDCCRILINAFLAALAGASGLGGGSLYSTCNLWFNGGDLKNAIPQSKPTILGCAVGGILVHCGQEWHNREYTSRIQYGVVALLEPATLLGALFGVILNDLLSDVIRIAVFLILCLSTLYKTFKLARKQKKQNSNTTSMDSETLESYTQLTPRHADVVRTTLMLGITSGISMMLLYLGGGPASLLSGNIYTTLAFLWLSVVVALNASASYRHLRVALDPRTGDPYWESDLDDNDEAIVGGRGWHTMTTDEDETRPALTKGLKVHWRAQARSRRAERQAARTTLILVGGGICAGILAGSVGVGGGLIKMPLLLHFGLTPLNAVASSLYMVVFTSSTTCTMFVIGTKLQASDLPLPFLAGLTGTFVGNILVRHCLIRSDPAREIYLTRLILFVVSLCILAVVYIKFTTSKAIGNSASQLLHPFFESDPLHGYLTYR